MSRLYKKFIKDYKFLSTFHLPKKPTNKYLTKPCVITDDTYFTVFFFLCIFCAFYCYKSRALVIIFFVLINNFHKHLCFMYTIFTAHSITCLFFRIIVEYVTYNKSYEFCGNSMKQHEIRTNHNNRLFYPRLVC